MITYDDSFEILTAPEDFDIVADALRGAGYEFVDSDVEYLPSMEATPTDKSDINNLALDSLFCSACYALDSMSPL